MDRTSDLAERITLGSDERLIRKYSEWQGKRVTPWIPMIAGILFPIILFGFRQWLLGLVIIAAAVAYFMYKTKLSPVLAGTVMLTDRRLLMVSRLKGRFTDRFEVDGIGLDTVIGADSGRGLLLRGGRRIEEVSGDLAGQVLTEVLSQRYATVKVKEVDHAELTTVY